MSENSSTNVKTKYIYHPVKFYAIAYALTWLFWIPAIFIKNEVALLLMFLGLCMPPAVAIFTVFSSKNDALKNDFKRKLFRFYKVKPLSIIAAILTFIAIVVFSILASVLFAGQSFDQFSFSDFSFSMQGGSALLTILLASVIEEIGWRGYGEDSIASYCSWFKESIIFGFVWSFWHFPMFFIEGTYHNGLIAEGFAQGVGYGFMINFLVSVVPLGFLTTWVYVKNNRSMLSCIIFHLFVNFMQEKIAMTPVTKCVETAIVTIAAIVIVVMNKEMFFEKEHIGNIISEE